MTFSAHRGRDMASPRSTTGGSDLGRSQKFLSVVVALVIVIAIAIRVHAWLTPFPFFVDEVLVAENLLTRSALALWKPLELAQTAPPLFLVAEKAIGGVFGYSETAMRALPLIAGCALLPMAWFVSRPLVSAEARVVLVALLAFSPSVIFYADFLKQYSSDVLTTLVIIAVTLRALRTPDWRHVIGVAIVGVVAILFRARAFFCLPALGQA